MALDCEQVLDMLAGLTLLKYFPADPGARLELAKMVAGMATSESQVEWLTGRVLALCNEWPGPRVMRQIFCSKFTPRDGIDISYSGMFPEGVPSERGLLPAPELLALALPPGHQFTTDPELEAEAASAVENMPRIPARRPLSVRAEKFARELEEILTGPQDRPLPPSPTNPNYQPITQEDIQQAVLELHKPKGATA